MSEYSSECTPSPPGLAGSSLEHTLSSTDVESDCGSNGTNEKSPLPKIPKPLRVLITGGCGFLGPHIGYWVYRELPPTTEIVLLDDVIANKKACVQLITGKDEDARVEVVRADVTQPKQVHNKFDEHKPDIVFHCAAVSELNSTVPGLVQTRMENVNVKGTQCIIDECIHAHVSVLIYTGSLAQVLPAGIHNQQLQIDEQFVTPTDELLAQFYGRTKKDGEHLVLSASNQLLTCSIRCPPMYGEYDKNLIPKVALAAKKFWGFYPSCGDSRRTMAVMYVGNAAWAHVCAAKRLLDKRIEVQNLVNGEAFVVGDDTPPEWAIDFYKKFLKSLRFRFSPRIPVLIPTIFFYIYVAIILFFWVFLDTNIPSPVLNYRRQIKILSVSHKVIWTKAKRLLHYEPKYKPKDAIQNSLETWYHTKYDFFRNRSGD